MLHGKTVAVVVPAYNEERQISSVIETMPEFVDRIVIVNDCSKDDTERVVMEHVQKDSKSSNIIKAFPNPVQPNRYNEADQVLERMTEEEIKFFVPSEVKNERPESSRIILINQLRNSGVGSAIARGYKWCKDHEIDCTAVMAGDGQMDPAELESICAPVILEDIDYVKGNRLRHPSARHVIPSTRFIGNSIMSMLTKIASGYWRVSDTQTGYTAISKAALNAIRIYDIYASYGMPNDMLVKLNINQCTIREVVIKPVYKVGEQSKMKVQKVIFKGSWLLLRLFFKRVWEKYFLRDFHPLFLFYVASLILGVASLPFGIQILKSMFIKGEISTYSLLLGYVFLAVTSIQSFIFAMWMDIQDNERLNK